MTHPTNLAAVAAVHSLRQAYRWCREAIADEAVQRVQLAPGPSGPARSTSALRRFDALLRAERDERIHADRVGITQIGATAAPVRVELLDAQRSAELHVAELVWDVHYALWLHPLLEWGPEWVQLAGGRWPGMTGYLLLTLPLVDPDAAAAAGRSLDRRDAAARVALRVDRTRERLRGNPPCPGCGERLLRVESACPPAARVVVCTAGCQCTGQQTCPCGMPVRTEWAPHVWLESDLDHVLQYNRVDRWVRSAAAMAARVGNGQRTAEEAAACSTSPG